jgi:hypothetical protein
VVDAMSWSARHRRAAGLLALVAGLGCPLGGRAGDDEVILDPVPGEQRFSQPNMVDLGSNFDANLFEQRGNGWVLQSRGRVMIRGGGAALIVNGGSAEAGGSPAFSRARAAGEKQLERIEKACGLSEPQRRLMLLAIESDARRFAAEIDAVRGRYQDREVNMNEPAGQKQWHAFQQDVQRCRDRLRRLYGEGSLFASVLGGTLDERQLACLDEERAARQSFHWRAMVAEELVKLDDSLALGRQQHEAIERLLVAREPALRIDDLSPPFDDANLRKQLVFLVLSQVDQSSLRAAVNDRQWKSLQTLTNQGRAMRSWIEQQGILERPGQ